MRSSLPYLILSAVALAVSACDSSTTVSTDADACPPGLGGYPAACCDASGNVLSQCSGYNTSPSSTATNDINDNLNNLHNNIYNGHRNIDWVTGSSGSSGVFNSGDPLGDDGASSSSSGGGRRHQLASTSSSSGDGDPGDPGSSSSSGGDLGAGTSSSSSSGTSFSATGTGTPNGVDPSGVGDSGGGPGSPGSKDSLLDSAQRLLASLWSSAATEGTGSSGANADATPSSSSSGDGTGALIVGAISGGGATSGASNGDQAALNGAAGGGALGSAWSAGGGPDSSSSGGTLNYKGNSGGVSRTGGSLQWNDDEGVDVASLEAAGFKPGDIGTMLGLDPADYFARLDIHDSLFKKVTRRYQLKSMQWSMAAADQGVEAARALAAQVQKPAHAPTPPKH